MTQLERADLHAAIETRYADNTTEDITPLLLRDGLHELVDSVFVTATDTGAVPNVPLYQAGTTYVVGFTVRFTPLSGNESFYAAKKAGKLTAPGSNFTDWKVVPGPVTPTALSQSITLLQAQGLDQTSVVAGREYLIDFGVDAQGATQTITVRGVANDFFDVAGTLEVAGVRTPVTAIDVQAGTWQLIGAGSALTEFQQFSRYGVSSYDIPADLLNQALAIAILADLTVNLPPLTLADLPAVLWLRNANASGQTFNLIVQGQRVLNQGGVGELVRLAPGDVARIEAVKFPVQAGFVPVWVVTQQPSGAGTVKSVNGLAPDAAGNVALATINIFPSRRKRDQVTGTLFTSGGPNQVADVVLSGDTEVYFYRKFRDFVAGYTYECFPNPSQPDAQGNATPWWVRS